MSDVDTQVRRGRPPRDEVNASERRRRQGGSLNRLIITNLGIPEFCKDPEYHYAWVKNSRGRVQALTTQDDYDIVTFDMLEDTARQNRVDYTVNRDGYVANGSIVTQHGDTGGADMILCRKPMRFVQADYEEGLDIRQAMMEARVYEGELDGAPAGRGETLDPAATYVPKGNTLGDTVLRRRGPIPRKIK